MKDTSLEAIRSQALNWHKAGTAWHFHILSPTCMFNSKSQYAFILEQTIDKTLLVHYSDRPEKELGKELSPLLHHVSAESSTAPAIGLTGTAKEIVDRATGLNERGVEWHHHILFPGCDFNGHSPKFVLILEDPSSGEMLEDLSDEEPTETLRYLEPLFYARTAPKD